MDQENEKKYWNYCARVTFFIGIICYLVSINDIFNSTHDHDKAYFYTVIGNAILFSLIYILDKLFGESVFLQDIAECALYSLVFSLIVSISWHFQIKELFNAILPIKKPIEWALFSLLVFRSLWVARKKSSLILTNWPVFGVLGVLRSFDKLGGFIAIPTKKQALSAYGLMLVAPFLGYAIASAGVLFTTGIITAFFLFVVVIGAKKATATKAAIAAQLAAAETKAQEHAIQASVAANLASMEKSKAEEIERAAKQTLMASAWQTAQQQQAAAEAHAIAQAEREDKAQLTAALAHTQRQLATMVEQQTLSPDEAIMIQAHRSMPEARKREMVRFLVAHTDALPFNCFNLPNWQSDAAFFQEKAALEAQTQALGPLAKTELELILAHRAMPAAEKRTLLASLTLPKS